MADGRIDDGPDGAATTDAPAKPELTLDRVSSAAIRDATGSGWPEWLERLDRAGADDWDHPTIVAHLERHHGEATSAWWRQTIAVGYEQARGKRQVGQTATVGFQIGVSRTVVAPVPVVWELLTTQPELWLGERVSVAFTPGGQLRVPPDASGGGATGTVRVVRPGHRLRMGWHPDGWDAPATLQLTLTPSGDGKTVIGFHLEKLPDAQTRERMRHQWRTALERITDAL